MPVLETGNGRPETATPRVALIAGEISGDILGASIVAALKARLPQARFYGVAGPNMVAAGCEAIESIDALSVMGLAEVLRHLPRLLALRRRLLARLSAERPDVFVGIDAPDFNLGIERRLRSRGVRTVHVVSPTIWAWRAGRVHTIGAAVDRILCLYPFEPPLYAAHGIAADYIGHPLADRLADSTSPAEARLRLGLGGDGPLVAVLPGSRASEIRHLAEAFAQAVARLQAHRPRLRALTPVARPELRSAIEAAIHAHAPAVDWRLIDGDAHTAMRAADAVLLASGTATLECLLLGRPMVVAYRGSALTAFLMLRMGLLKSRYVSLPNLLCAEPVVPELLQDEAQPERLCAELARLLEDPAARRRQLEQFAPVRRTLHRSAAERAAEAIAAVLADVS